MDKEYSYKFLERTRTLTRREFEDFLQRVKDDRLKYKKYNELLSGKDVGVYCGMLLSHMEHFIEYLEEVLGDDPHGNREKVIKDDKD